MTYSSALSREDFDEALRQAENGKPEDIEYAMLETNVKISLVMQDRNAGYFPWRQPVALPHEL